MRPARAEDAEPAPKQGLVKAERHDFHEHRQVWWLEIAADTTARLEQLAAALRRG